MLDPLLLLTVGHNQGDHHRLDNLVRAVPSNKVIKVLHDRSALNNLPLNNVTSKDLLNNSLPFSNVTRLKHILPNKDLLNDSKGKHLLISEDIPLLLTLLPV